jgi:1,4-dihydroxy-2-naphthoyl-CoA hydrolase
LNISLEEFNQIGRDFLPGLLGVEFLEATTGRMVSRLDVAQRHHAPNGYLHAATVVALADTSCGYGCRLSLPEDATGFTTIELKSNFLGTVHEGGIRCEARLVHGGRSTQVWDATVTSEANGKPIALFRCTQMVLYQKPPSPTST